MVKVFVHFRQTDGGWKNKGIEISRVPCVDEFITLDYNSPRYKVVSVTHCPSCLEYDAEINIMEV